MVIVRKVIVRKVIVRKVIVRKVIVRKVIVSVVAETMQYLALKCACMEYQCQNNNSLEFSESLTQNESDKEENI